ncbi:hypothetical protein T4B_3392, partial [Trichinella pseudospiralis]
MVAHPHCGNPQLNKVYISLITNHHQKVHTHSNYDKLASSKATVITDQHHGAYAAPFGAAKFNQRNIIRNAS